jgi:hypothetical protein
VSLASGGRIKRQLVPTCMDVPVGRGLGAVVLATTIISRAEAARPGGQVFPMIGHHKSHIRHSFVAGGIVHIPHLRVVIVLPSSWPSGSAST